MLELRGKYNSAKVFTDNVEQTAMSQIIELCNQEFTKDLSIRIMPDTHAGAGCTVGTTMTIKDKIVPNLVGVDIGCGMEVVMINKTKDEIDFGKLDEVIRKYVPSGFNIRSKPHQFASAINIADVIAPINKDRAVKSVGTLGGGNHFIEINEDREGKVYIVIHSGSRNLGKQVAEYYQNVAYETLTNLQGEKDRIIKEFKAMGWESKIQNALAKIKPPKFQKDLAWLEGDNFKNYMHDMEIAQRYAMFNRQAMAVEIIKHMGWTVHDNFTTIHNYIDMDNMIMRKGAISAQKGERVIIPINMRDGSIIAYGKGNSDWNYSAPHGAGRVLSRSKAKELLSFEEYERTMSNVWTTSVSSATIDESPMAYKTLSEILSNSFPTIDVHEVIKPLYNFKAS